MRFILLSLMLYGCANNTPPITAFTHTSNDPIFTVSCSPGIEQCIKRIQQECGIWGYQTLEEESVNKTHKMLVKCL